VHGHAGSRARSIASELLNAMMARFEPGYAVSIRLPRTPAVEPTLMTRPLPRVDHVLAELPATPNDAQVVGVEHAIEIGLELGPDRVFWSRRVDDQ
jgi:hypothetical protein